MSDSEVGRLATIKRLRAEIARLTEQRDRAMAVVRLYLTIYADAQKHPTTRQEVAVIVAARAALDVEAAAEPGGDVDG